MTLCIGLEKYFTCKVNTFILNNMDHNLKIFQIMMKYIAVHCGNKFTALTSKMYSLMNEKQDLIVIKRVLSIYK